MWAALRFDLRGATLAALTVAIVATSATLFGTGPLVHPDPIQTTISLQIVLAVTVVMGLVIGSVTAERQRALDAWQAATEDLRAVFNAAPVAIVATDGSRVIRWNEGAERMFGWTRAEVVGKPLPYIPDDVRREFDGLMARQERGEAIVGFETVRLHKDGRRAAREPFAGRHPGCARARDRQHGRARGHQRAPGGAGAAARERGAAPHRAREPAVRVLDPRRPGAVRDPELGLHPAAGLPDRGSGRRGMGFHRRAGEL